MVSVQPDKIFAPTLSGDYENLTPAHAVWSPNCRPRRIVSAHGESRRATGIHELVGSYLTVSSPIEYGGGPE
jgi:hypothetical protein